MQDRQADIVICGGSFSAPAVALAAARANPNARIVLTEPTAWFGGQTTSQGVSAIDNAWHEPGKKLMAENTQDYYPKDYLDFIQRIKDAGDELPGDGYGGDMCSWVSRESFDPRTAASILDNMIAENSQIEVLKLTVVKEVNTREGNSSNDRAIESIIFNKRTPRDGYTPHDLLLSREITDWYSTEESDIYTKESIRITAANPEKGLVVVDSSELGDVIVLSGARYTVGREEAEEEVREDGTLPPIDENGTQAFVYVYCAKTAENTDPENEVKAMFSGFDEYLKEQTETFYSQGPHSWEKIWTYRRLRTIGGPNEFDTIYPNDVSMQNWYPGNDYPYGSLLKSPKESESELKDWYGAVDLYHLAQAELHAVGWHFYMKERVSYGMDIRYCMGDDQANFMGTRHGLAMFPYIRGTRRIIGLDNFRLTTRYLDDCEADGYDNTTSFRFFDSVGIGCYAVDVHPTKNSEGATPPFEKAAPFYVPYRALASVNVENLLVAGKLIATTYITNAAYRLHPIEWVIGSACGAAAGMMAITGESTSDLYKIDRLRNLQDEVAKNSPIHWKAYDKKATPERDGDLIINDRKPFVPGDNVRIEAFHPEAARAVVEVDGEAVTESGNRVNGRFSFEVKAPANASDVSVRLYSSQGEELTVLQG